MFVVGVILLQLTHMQIMILVFFFVVVMLNVIQTVN